MAFCEYCGKDMLKAKGCRCIPVPIKGKGYMEPLRCWEDKCHDCNASFGQYHHPGCDNEICPNCGGQLISCECMYSIPVTISIDELNVEIANHESILENHLHEDEWYDEFMLEEYKSLLKDKNNGIF